MRHDGSRARFVETPSFARICALLVVLGPVTPVRAQVLSEADVVRLARARAPGIMVADATERLADAREETAGRFPSPSLAWERETLFTGGDSVQDVFRATVPIDLARPLATRSLVATESAWARAEAAADRTDAVLEAVLAFYDAVVAQRRAEVLDGAVISLDEAARVLARREAAGTASGYESTRLGVASELARSEAAEARGALRAARARLAALIGDDARTLRLDATLALAPLPSEEELVRRGTTVRDVAEHARASARSAREAEGRASWAWFPSLELNGGANIVRDLETRYGYVLGVSLSLPLFDSGQALRAEAGAMRALADARTEAVTRAIRADVGAAYARYEALRTELERFEAATSEQVDALLAAAQSGYREGERTIVELLDAQRARTEVAERWLELAGDTKRAEARVRAAAGVLR